MLTQQEFLDGIYELAKTRSRTVSWKLPVALLLAGTVLFCLAASQVEQPGQTVLMQFSSTAQELPVSGSQPEGIAGVVSSAELIVSGNREGAGFVVSQCYKGECEGVLELAKTSEKMVPAQKQVLLFLEQNPDGTAVLVDTPNHVLVYEAGEGAQAEYQLSDGSVVSIGKLQNIIEETGE